VAKALIAAHKRGAEVQWVTDNEHGIDAADENGSSPFEMMEDAGIEIVDDGRGALMHNKFLISEEHLVWTGSTNITKNGNFRNHNNAILIESRRVAEMYEHEFAEISMDESFGPHSPSFVEWQSKTVNGTSIEVRFASEYEVMLWLIPIVQ
jgi:phosphatidylserine/phosphatidylglycerophosphate/cardiolipin synthase-like enzyme